MKRDDGHTASDKRSDPEMRLRRKIQGNVTGVFILIQPPWECPCPHGLSIPMAIALYT